MCVVCDLQLQTENYIAVIFTAIDQWHGDSIPIIQSLILHSQELHALDNSL